MESGIYTGGDTFYNTNTYPSQLLTSTIANTGIILILRYIPRMVFPDNIMNHGILKISPKRKCSKKIIRKRKWKKMGKKKHYEKCI